jgi:hypothetical protein
MVGRVSTIQKTLLCATEPVTQENTGSVQNSPIIPIEVEASLRPPGIRLSKNVRQYALCALKLAPSHPINKEIARLDSASPERPIQLEWIRGSIQGLADL